MRHMKQLGASGILLSRRSVCQTVLGFAATAAILPLSACGSGEKGAGTATEGSTSADAVATTQYGKIRGTTAGSVKSFKGVPYGGDTAKTRFMRATPPESWTDVRDATEYGAECPQPGADARAARTLLSSWQIPQAQSEDCLFLNVWTAGLRDGGKRPVMVYLHGGGFSTGSGAATVYDGTHLAEKGVVVVTVNHRLNIFGYLYLGEIGGEQYADSGNVGQFDIIQALKWVRDNIEEFGGDPGNVLIYGESGGGAKVCTLLAMPEAKGLFHRAVVESGPMVWAVHADVATATAKQALGSLGVSPDALDGLGSVTTQQLQEAYAALGPATRTLESTVDGRGLPRDPFDPDAPSVSADVPLLIGFNSTETTFVLSGDPAVFDLTWDRLPDQIKPHIGSMDPAKVVAEYRKLMPDATPSDIFFDLTTQTMMTRNVLLIADRKAALKAAPVYLYELAWQTPVDGGKWKSPHTLEIPLVFDNVASASSTYGSGADEAQKVADQMSAAWVAFAKSGNPNVNGVPEWPAYDPATRPTMTFNVESKVFDNPMGDRVAILQDAPYWDMSK